MATAPEEEGEEPYAGETYETPSPDIPVVPGIGRRTVPGNSGDGGYSGGASAALPTDPGAYGAQFIGTGAFNQYLTSIPLLNGGSVVVNKTAANNFKNFLDEIWNRGVKYQSVGGYNARRTIGRNGKSGGKWSRHALGLAVDIDPTKNPYRSPGYTGSLPLWVGEVAAKNGIVWGADFGDSMHFSVRVPKLSNVAGG